MKTIVVIAVVTLLSLVIGGFAIAESHGGFQGHGTPHGKDTDSMVKHLTEAFARVVPFDADKDGQLDATEKESLAKAIVDGTVQLPAHTPPDGVKPSAEAMLNHIADMYAFLARIDANHDGALDATEQAALKSAVEKGELASLHPHH